MIYKTSLRATFYQLCIASIIGSSWGLVVATGPESTPDICALCTDELYETNTPVIFFDCDQKALHGYHLNCTDDLFAKNYKKCPLCDKPAKFFNPLIKSGDYSKIHGLKRALTQQEQNYLKTFLQKWAPYQSRKAFPTELLPQPAPQPEIRETIQPTPKEVPSKVTTKERYDDLSTDFIAQLTEQQRKELFDIPVAKEQFPPIPLSEEDIKLNSELPKDLDPKEWQVIVTREGKRLRAHRSVKLTQWPPTELEKPTSTFSFPKEIKNVGKKLEGTPGDLALGFCAGLLTAREFEPAKEWPLTQLKAKEADVQNLSKRRFMYTPALLGGYFLSKKLNPQRKFDTKTCINLGLGYILGVGLHLFLHPQQA